MVDVIQIVLLFVIVLLAVVLIILGIQVFFILKDFRQTVQKTNKILDDVDLISESVAQPMAAFSGFLTGAKSLSAIAKVIQLLRK